MSAIESEYVIVIQLISLVAVIFFTDLTDNIKYAWISDSYLMNHLNLLV